MTETPTDPSTRLVAALIAGERRGEYTYRGPAARHTGYVVELAGGRRRVYDTAGMWAWLRARKLGAAAGPAVPPAGPRAELDAVRRLLVAPGLADQMRTQIRAAMEHVGMGVTALAAASGRNRGAIREALRWGAADTLSVRMAESMMAGTGCGWAIRYTRPESAVAELRPAAAICDAPPEPAGVRRMRAAVIADEHGLAVWTSPLDPNKAHRAAAFEFEVAGVPRRVPVGVVRAWLVGLADTRAATVADMLVGA